MKNVHLKKSLWAAGAVLLVILFLSALGHRHLSDPDEGRYAEIAKEMLNSGDWVTPRLLGIKYFEKPPLQYWATSAAYEIFGVSDWSARLWVGLAGLLTALLVGLTGARLWGAPAGIWSTCVLASSLLFYAMSHVIVLDMSLTLFMSLSLCAYLLVRQGDTRWSPLIWLGMALGTLTKGLVAVVLPVMAMGLWLASYWRPGVKLATVVAPIKNIGWRWGLFLYFMVSVPWFVLAYRETPEFLHFFFIHEHFQRYTSQIHNRVGPFWYFVPALLLGMLPWTFSALHAFKLAWIEGTKNSSIDQSITRLLVIWIVVIFLFFSFSGSKLLAYILPIFPAWALLIGKFFPSLPPQQFRRHCLITSLIILLVLIAFIVTSAHIRLDRNAELNALLLHGSEVVLCVLFIGTLMAWVSHHRTYALACLTGITSIAWAVGLFIYGAIDTTSYHLCTQLRARITPNTKIYAVSGIAPSFAFYLDRPITLVNYRDEYDFGLKLEPQLGMDMKTFLSQWHLDDNQILLAKHSVYNKLLTDGLLVQNPLTSRHWYAASPWTAPLSMPVPTRPPLVKNVQ